MSGNFESAMSLPILLIDGNIIDFRGNSYNTPSTNYVVIRDIKFNEHIKIKPSDYPYIHAWVLYKLEE